MGADFADSPAYEQRIHGRFHRPGVKPRWKKVFVNPNSFPQKYAHRGAAKLMIRHWQNHSVHKFEQAGEGINCIDVPPLHDVWQRVDE